jgi:hypothetical protein
MQTQRFVEFPNSNSRQHLLVTHVRTKNVNCLLYFTDLIGALRGDGYHMDWNVCMKAIKHSGLWRGDLSAFEHRCLASFDFGAKHKCISAALKTCVLALLFDV